MTSLARELGRPVAMDEARAAARAALTEVLAEDASATRGTHPGP
jgi:hypothetical protein